MYHAGKETGSESFHAVAQGATYSRAGEDLRFLLLLQILFPVLTVFTFRSILHSAPFFPAPFGIGQVYLEKKGIQLTNLYLEGTQQWEKMGLGLQKASFWSQRALKSCVPYQPNNPSFSLIFLFLDEISETALLSEL